LFKRGFKSWCERYATDKRLELGFSSTDPLDAKALATNLGVLVWTPEDVPNLSATSKEILLRNDGKSSSDWSAVTVVVAGKRLVILNSSHSLGRQSSDLMHELAHIILDHQSQELNISSEGVLMLSAYEKDQEDEADWLCGCLLLPRSALVSIMKNSLDLPENAKVFKVSMSMMKYRLSMTGVTRQFK
jgi:Zn-dependent peptidase ImmA (M78 family)